MGQPSSFHEVRFPTGISFGSSGGPERRTEIVTLGSGHERRNARWAHSRRRYDAGYGVKNLDDLHAVISFFEERRGALCGFRFRDPMDWKSCPPLGVPASADQNIGSGDGVTATFALIKTYGSGGSEYVRLISKPEAGSVVIAVDSTEQTEGSDFVVDYTTGAVEFTSPAIPPVGAGITAGFHFDVPVRFANDQLSINIDAFKAGDIPSIPLMELRI